MCPNSRYCTINVYAGIDTQRWSPKQTKKSFSRFRGLTLNLKPTQQDFDPQDFTYRVNISNLINPYIETPKLSHM